MAHDEPDDDSPDRIGGDPGIGALIADPLDPRGKRNRVAEGAGVPDPDPPPPQHHGDWSPTHDEKQS